MQLRRVKTSMAAKREGKSQQRGPAREVLDSDLQSRPPELHASIKVLRKEIDEIWDIPELKKHRVCISDPDAYHPLRDSHHLFQYLLRGVSYYVGFDSPTAYHTYVRQDDGKWWKLAQSGATEVSADTTRVNLIASTEVNSSRRPFRPSSRTPQVSTTTKARSS
jgi:hypothetical protein